MVLSANVDAITMTSLTHTSVTFDLFGRDPLRIKRSSGWQVTTRSRRGGNATSHGIALRLLGHLLSTALIYLALLCLTWVVSQRVVFLSSVGELPDDTSRFLARLKLAILYGEGTLFAYFWAMGAWQLFKEMKR